MPTRAEITDVANAVFEQADAIMLSGETTVGKYPLQCLEVLNRIAERIEQSGGAGYHERAEFTNARQKLAKSAVVMADELRAHALLVFTIRGNMARYTGWMRPRHSPIYGFCESPELANALTLIRGLTPVLIPFCETTREETIQKAVAKLRETNRIKSGNTLVIVSSIPGGDTTVDAVQMRTV